MKPRIEKKLSKRLVEIAPLIFKDAWVDSEFELFPKHYAFRNKDGLSPKQKRQNYQQRVSVNHVHSMGGGKDYWGEMEDCYTCWDWWKSNWCWYGDFDAYPAGHQFVHYPNTECFRPTTRNLLKLAKQKGNGDG